MFVQRQAKKKCLDIVKGCSSNGGKLYMYVKPEPNLKENDRNTPRNRRIFVGNVHKLKSFCDSVLNFGLDNFIET